MHVKRPNWSLTLKAWTLAQISDAEFIRIAEQIGHYWGLRARQLVERDLETP